MIACSEIGDVESVQRIRYELGKLYVAQKQAAVKHLVTHPYSFTNIRNLYRQFNENFPMFAELTDGVYFKQLADSLKVEYPQSPYVKALEKAQVKCPDAIITGTALGCWENSEALLMQLEEEGEVMLKPTNFMQSTHNTISSNIAIRLGCHGYNVTYTQCDRSLEWALRDARLLLQSGRYKTVLVGCHDETTPLYRSLMDRLGVTNLPSIHSIAMVFSRNEE